MEELTVVKAPVFRFSLSHGRWLVALANGPFGQVVQWKAALLTVPYGAQPYGNLKVHLKQGVSMPIRTFSQVWKVVGVDKQPSQWAPLSVHLGL